MIAFASRAAHSLEVVKSLVEFIVEEVTGDCRVPSDCVSVRCLVEHLGGVGQVAAFGVHRDERVVQDCDVLNGEAMGEFEDGGVNRCTESVAPLLAAEGEEGAEVGVTEGERDISHLLCFFFKI